MNIIELEALLRANVEKAKSDGWTLATSTFGSESKKTCCIVTAGGNPNESTASIKKRLNVSDSQMWSLIEGFDNTRSSTNSYCFYALGAKLRKELLT